MASGCLGLISFPREPGRLTLEQIEALYPRLIKELRDHEGVGFLLVDSERDGALAIGAEGVNRLEKGEVLGERPAGAVRPERGPPCPPHPPLPALSRHRRQQPDLARPDRGRRIRGARRLARRDGRLAVVPVRARPGRPRLARRRGRSAPRRSTTSSAAGSRGSARTPTRTSRRRRRRAPRRGRAAPPRRSGASSES